MIKEVNRKHWIYAYVKYWSEFKVYRKSYGANTDPDVFSKIQLQVLVSVRISLK